MVTPVDELVFVTVELSSFFNGWLSFFSRVLSVGLAVWLLTDSPLEAFSFFGNEIVVVESETGTSVAETIGALPKK